jgi:hypothetical protein
VGCKTKFYSCIEWVGFSCCLNGMFAILLPPSRWYDVCITSHINKPKNQLGEYHQLQCSSRLFAWRTYGTADVIVTLLRYKNSSGPSLKSVAHF